jgi:hypothetical protein
MGPYGTNEGDVWLGMDSPVQKRLDEDGLVLVHEMLVKDGELQECIYVTRTPELIERAQKGHERWMEANRATVEGQTRWAFRPLEEGA